MYTISKDSKVIIRTADKACIPDDPYNSDYQEFIKWQVSGGVAKIEKDNPVIVENEKISRLQVDLMPEIIEAVMALLNKDSAKIADVKAKIESKITVSGVDSVRPKDVTIEVIQVQEPPVEKTPVKEGKG